MAKPQVPRRKLIEVALPLDVINREAAREKSIRHGHPSTLHLWWARRPLAACRAVLFAQLVDDPSSHPERFPTEAEQDIERKRLFGIIERLVPWEASNDEAILDEAREEIRRSCGDCIIRTKADTGSGRKRTPFRANPDSVPAESGHLV
jgi:putative DNA methylase